MSLDFCLEQLMPTEVYSGNITHNFGKMAVEAGIYEVLWHPEKNGFDLAWKAIAPLEKGLALLRSDPERFKALNTPDGWGKYEHFVPFVAEVLAACREYPKARIRASV